MCVSWVSGSQSILKWFMRVIFFFHACVGSYGSFTSWSTSLINYKRGEKNRNITHVVQIIISIIKSNTKWVNKACASYNCLNLLRPDALDSSVWIFCSKVAQEGSGIACIWRVGKWSISQWWLRPVTRQVSTAATSNWIIFGHTLMTVVFLFSCLHSHRGQNSCSLPLILSAYFGRITESQSLEVKRNLGYWMCLTCQEFFVNSPSGLICNH